MGPKNEAASYAQIANSFAALQTSDILFISDVTKELDAAASAGLNTLLCVRPGNHPQPPHAHTTVTTFDGLD